MQIETLEIQTADPDQMRQFYCGRLGFPLIFESEETSTIAVGASTLVLVESAAFSGRYHFAFNVPQNRLGAAKAFLGEHNIPLLPDENGDTIFHFESWNAHSVYFLDPAGNILEFIARHELSNSVPGGEPFSATEILNISEIGLAVADVEVLSSQLCEGCGITPYREIFPTFAPLGDAHGLFILVPQGRIWFPNTGVAAEALPVRVLVRGSEGLLHEVVGFPYACSRVSNSK